MKIHLYSIAWNEAKMLEFFFRHYEPWVERFVIYDNGSTDQSLEILSRKPNVEVRPFPYAFPDSYVYSAKAVQDQCWKESRGLADWVIVTAIDEHLHHRHLLEYLQRCKQRGITYIPALGFQMITRDFPAPHEHLATTRTRGSPFSMMSKLRIFDPDAIEETDFVYGGHGARPVGRLRLPLRDELLLLHYKFLGIDYIRKRAAALDTQVGVQDRAEKWDAPYTMERVDKDWRKFVDYLVDLSDPAYIPWVDHFEGRWWRSRYDPGEILRGVAKKTRALMSGRPTESRGRVSEP